MTQQTTEQCPHCPHTVTGSPWWVGQQMPIHVHYAHPERREHNDYPPTPTGTTTAQTGR